MADPALIQPSLAHDPSLVALARLPERITGLDAMPVVTLDVDHAPAPGLEHLADQFRLLHTVAWRRASTDVEKRGLIKTAMARHRVKGTLAGLRLAVKDTGAQLAGVVVPPAKTYAGSSLSISERNAFISLYPQLRIYPRRSTGKRVGALLWAIHAGGHAYPVQSDAAMRLASQAYLYRDGAETPLHAVEREFVAATGTAVVVTEVHVPSVASVQAFVGQPACWLLRSDASDRIYRLTTRTPYREAHENLRRVAASPGLSLLNVRYDWVAGVGVGRGHFASRSVEGYLRRSTARERIYQRLWLYDPAVSLTRRGVASFAGASRLSMPAHHAELALSVPGRLARRIARRWVYGYLMTTDRTTYHDTLEALREMARASDRISLDTAVHRPLVSRTSVLAGTAVAGEWRAA